MLNSTYSVNGSEENVFIVWAQLVDENATSSDDLVQSNITNTNVTIEELNMVIEWSGSKVGIMLASLAILMETVTGNFLVIVAVITEKKLQTPFNYYIVNLAISDMNVGMSVMSLFIVYNLYGFFPFDSRACAYWIWSDWTMTFESVATLTAIRYSTLFSIKSHIDAVTLEHD